MEEVKNKRPIHTRESWDKLYVRLREEQLIPEQRDATKNKPVGNLLKIAAVVLILLGIAAGVYMNVSRKPAVTMVRLNTVNEANTLIKTLTDGSVIYLAQNSLFSFPEEFKSASRNVELKGEAFFDIMPNSDKPFIIETDEALIQVLGTAFNVKTKNVDGFELFVDRGKVKVTLKKNPVHSEMVIAGEKISTVNNSLVKSKYTANEATAWYKQRMHFKDEKLQNIITVLNRNFNTNFVLADNEIGKHKLTVTFQSETAGTMTELICVALNLKSQTINGSVVLSEIKKGAKQN
ncbi:MAG: FecR domain-containing protein [Bacteroidales bacterium]|jgi:ferric-dicitrate binding protein FerR (iron transport regulator)|nr:FecR domain-containing protein [Bacteroidales bacterium]